VANSQSTKIELITTEEASRLLDVPLLAMGQIVADGFLILTQGFYFLRKDVDNLSAHKPHLVARYR